MPSPEYPEFLSMYTETLAALRERTSAPILVAGAFPIWDPYLSKLAEKYARTKQPMPLRLPNAVQESLKLDGMLEKVILNAGAVYLPLVLSLCEAKGCMTVTGPRFPEDLITFDYGHFSTSGSLLVARQMLVPQIEAELAKLTPEKP